MPADEESAEVKQKEETANGVEVKEEANDEEMKTVEELSDDGKNKQSDYFMIQKRLDYRQVYKCVDLISDLP